ncbi:MAG: AtpZ/AtpI family protein [Alphaproteobacteria bacterium]
MRSYDTDHMTNDNNNDPLNSLAARLRNARESSGSEAPGATVFSGVRQGLGFAMRIGVELVSALIVGVLIGLALDYWLGTNPWCLLVFFVLGSIAGIFNVYRTAAGLSQTVGYRANLKNYSNRRVSREETEGNKDSG